MAILDVVAACELAHVIYFQNPGKDIRTKTWERVIPPVASNRGSFIRVFAVDLDGDGKPEIVSPNKGAQGPRTTQPPTAISWFKITGPPLDGASWVEHELTKVVWPINSQPVDLDGDGDLDIIGGSVAETRIILFENMGAKRPQLFRERPIKINGTSITGNDRPANHRNDNNALISGFNMEFVDLSGDGRLDIVTWEFTRLVGRSIVWLEQPATLDGVWQLHAIGDYSPDEVVGIAIADINGDGLIDVMTGGYSGGARDAGHERVAQCGVGPAGMVSRIRAIAAIQPRVDASRHLPPPPRHVRSVCAARHGRRRRHRLRLHSRQQLDLRRRLLAGTGSHDDPAVAFKQARQQDSPEVPLPAAR